LILDRIDHWFAAVERFGGSIARRQRLAVAICGLLVLLVRLAELPRMPVPPPLVLDEFAHMLAADTFASGRLTNPQHPMWTHFESFHILQSPTYMSMYPPAQGMFMALGQKLAGVPWIGVLISMSLCCAAICWMLQGWLPPGWAFFGGLLIAMRIGVFTYWMNTYYGGGVAALGGALLFGALPRVMRRPNVRDALLLSLGLAIVANSRPYEGLIAAIPVAGALVYWLLRGRGLFRGRAADSSKWLRVAAPIAVTMALTIAGIGYYNWRITGDPLLFPQTLNRQTYAIAPYFVWESLRPEPPYRHEVMRKFYTEVEAGFQMSDQQYTLEGWLASAVERFLRVWRFFPGTALSFPLLLLPLALRDRRMRFWAWAAPVFLVGLLLARFTQSHYVAPMMAGVFVLFVQSMRHLRHVVWDGSPVGLWAVRIIALIAAASFVNNAIVAQTGVDYHWQFDRAQLQDRLEHMPGEQLVIVRYGVNHFLEQEWVYNRADIDHAKVVWAREMPQAADNADLQAYFHARACWILEPEVDQLKLTPCPPLVAP
jgi:hypothetical protein